MQIQSLEFDKDGYIVAATAAGELLLTAEQCAEFGLDSGGELSSAAFDELCLLSVKNRAAKEALKMLALRDMSRAELINKLTSKGYGDYAEYAADEMQKLGYLDDTKYARLMLLSYAEKGYNFARAASELEKKGIDRELAKKIWLEEGLGDIEPSAREFLENLAKSGDIDDPKWLRRAADAMRRAGYSEDEIASAIESVADYGG